GDELQELAAREALVQERLVRDVAEQLPRPVAVVDQIVPTEAHASSRRKEQSAHHLDGGCLARSRRPQESEQLAHPDVEAEALDGGLIAVTLGDVVQLNHADLAWRLDISCRA